MNSTYFIDVESGDMQDAISTELGVSVDEAIAQNVLGNFIDSTKVVAERGCSAQEECLSMMLSLMQQIGDNKDEILQFIDEAETL